MGSIEHGLRLPTDMVWVHRSLATVTWLLILWASAGDGSLAPRRVTMEADERRLAGPRKLETVS